MIKKLLKSKKIVVIALIAVLCGSYLYYKSTKSIKIQDVDYDKKEFEKEQKNEEAILDLTPNSNNAVVEETTDLGQSAQPEPAPTDTSVETFAMI